MQRQSGSHSRPSLLKRKRVVEDIENRENLTLFLKCDEASPTKLKSGEIPEPYSPYSAPLTPRDVFIDQTLNRSLGESCSSTKLDRSCPTPPQTWTESKRLWQYMCVKDKQSSCQRDPVMFKNHPLLRPRMRSILLDWIIEVCEVYKMHRETYNLAVDYLDRYLSIKKEVVKGQLQLTGITCLFIAAKIEEIYPPKLSEFAYVTDGACKEEQILDLELVILETLEWNLSTVTSQAWLSLFVQLCHSRVHGGQGSVVLPNHQAVKEYIQATQLCDFVLMHENSLRFSYGVLAASSVYFTSFKEQIISCSGLQWSDLAECIEWMSVFAQALREDRGPNSPIRVAATFSADDDRPNYLMQTRNVELTLLDKVQQRFQQQLAVDTPLPGHQSSVVLLTPPSSNKKPPN